VVESGTSRATLTGPPRGMSGWRPYRIPRL